MSESRRLAGGGGSLTIKSSDGNHLTLRVCLLPQRQEDDLIFDLRQVAGEIAKARGDDHVAAVEPILDRLDKLKDPAASRRAHVVLTVAAEMAARRDLPVGDVVESTRRSPRGLAREIWYRAKPLQPAIDLRELEAVITDANARDVFYAMREALAVEAGDPFQTP